MARMSLARVTEVLRGTNCTRMDAYDANNSLCDHQECESVGNLIDSVEDLVKNTSGTLRLECWSVAKAKAKGERTESPKPVRLTFHVNGMLHAGAPAPAAPVDKDGKPIVNHYHGGESVADAVALARLQWEVQALRERLAQAEQDEPEQDEPEPPQPALLWGMRPEVTEKLVGNLSTLVVEFIRTRSTPIGAAPTPTFTQQERTLLDAFYRFREKDPEMANGLLSQLMNEHGPTAAEPAPNGAAH